MIILKEYNSKLLICFRNSFTVLDTSSGEERIVRIPDQKIENTKHQLQENENRYISSACFSRSGEFIAVSAGKQLIVYAADLSVKRILYLQRSASKIRFSNDQDIVVADKTGDAYLYKLCNNDDVNDGSLLLGHLSMLLDILITECNKFVITCDRDEKIRVSCYPNSYNIMSYCLGHQEFVTNIEIINNHLVSASGDGTIRFWNYTTGKELLRINTNDYIKDKDLINRFCEEMDEEKCEVSCLPIIDMQVSRFQCGVLLAVSLHNYTNIQIYSAKINEDVVQCTFYCDIVLSCIPICMSFSNNLYVLTAEKLFLYAFKDDKFVEVASECVQNFYERHKNQFKLSDSVPISVMYKRKFDNVQEYLKKKKQRVEGKIKC